jgi:hypothetical protein
MQPIELEVTAEDAKFAIPGSCNDCVLSKALARHVGTKAAWTGSYLEDGNKVVYRHSEESRRLMNKFDSGGRIEYPVKVTILKEEP